MDWNQFFIILKNYDGILGVILGTVVTLIVSNVIRNYGKIHFYVNEYDVYLSHEGINESGNRTIERVNSLEKANYFNYALEIEFYNNSEIPKILRNIRIIIRRKVFNKVIFSKTINPNNVKHKEKFFYTDIRDGFKFINLEPKKIVNMRIEGKIGDKQIIENIFMGADIIMSALNQKNKSLTRLIYKGKK